MTMRGGRLWITIGCLLGLGQLLPAQNWEMSLHRSESAVKDPLKDDATLHDVALLGEHVWTVGDRGTLWISEDGGQSWKLRETNTSARLNSLCFLTDQVGWIAGGQFVPYVGISRGTLLATKDGGETWESVKLPALPEIRHVRFFDLQQGVIVTINGESASGIYRTQDGGATWERVSNSVQAAWRTAAFLSPDVGIVAGRKGVVKVVTKNGIQGGTNDESNPQSWHGVSLKRDGIGWICGDGALLFQTRNAGASWQPANTPFPREMRHFVDFQTVTHHGQNLWVTGSPGSCVWYSPDAGVTWRRQPTGIKAPLRKLIVDSDGRRLIGVGELGAIIRSEDQGRTWQVARGKNRRLAMLIVQAKPSELPAQTLAKHALEEGHRAASISLFRRDLGENQQPSMNHDLLLRDAAVLAGANGSRVAWRFPIELPADSLSTRDLLRLMNQQWDGEFETIAINRLIAAIRQWQPSMVLVCGDGSEQGVEEVLAHYVKQACLRAGDVAQASEHNTLCGLPPWQVHRLFVQRDPGDLQAPLIELYDLLPSQQATVSVAAKPVEALLSLNVQRKSHREAFRPVPLARESLQTTVPSLFAGLALGYGTDARRPAHLDQIELTDELQAQARHQRNMDAVIEQRLADPQFGGQLIAQLGDLMGHANEEQALARMFELHRRYRHEGQLDHAEAIALEMFQLSPQAPATQEALKWVFHYWSSQEMAWLRTRERRLRKQKSSSQVRFADSTTNEGIPIEQSYEVDQTSGSQAEEALFHRNAGREWRARALKVAEEMRESIPELYHSQEIQLGLGSIHRQDLTHRLADDVFRNLVMNRGESLSKTAAAELWAFYPRGEPPKPLTLVRRAAEKPFLDAVLSDVCWQDAVEVPLDFALKRDREPGRSPFIMMTYDYEYLYLAGSIPHHPQMIPRPAEMSGRSHDAARNDLDQIRFHFDTDRDYATSYSFHIDQTGATAEALWDLRHWNPEWFVAASSNAESWQFEAAIPLAELVENTSLSRVTWAFSIVRVIPGHNIQGTMENFSTEPTPDDYNLMRFQ